MNYDYFIGMAKHHETNRIRAFRGKQQTNPEHVPAAFALLMPEIFAAITFNLHTICNPDEGIVIFGLQPASAMIASNQPLELGRFIDGLQPDYHFCCTLDFFKAPTAELHQQEVWASTDSIVIDFTTGELMDSDRFLSKLHLLPKQGSFYGRINKEALDISWTIIKIKQAKNKHGGFLFNNILMDAPIAEVA